MKTEVYVWSAIGHAPVTHRRGSFCDELFHGFIEAHDPSDARRKTIELCKNTPHADKGWFNIPDWPNQNTRSQWVGPRDDDAVSYSVVSAT